MGMIDTIRKWFGRDAPLSLDDWATYWQYGGNKYISSGFTETLKGDREEIPSTFAGYVEQIKKTNAVAFACMDVRRRLFSEARLTFRQFTDGRPGELFGGRDGRNPAYRDLALLASPWPGGTQRDLLSRAIDYADAGGNSFIIRRPSRLRFARPDWMTILLGSDDDRAVQAGDLDADVIGYIHHPGGRHSGRQPETLLPNQVAHWAPIPDPTASYRGMSWLTPIIREIAGDSAMTTFKGNYLEHGATPNLVVTLDPNISLSDAREFIALFKQDHEGIINAGKTLFLGGGSTPVPVGSNLQEIDFKSVQGAGETRIAAAAGVPPIIVGLSEGLASATYSNYGQARRAFADLTMRPLWGGFVASLANIVDVPLGAELWYDDRDISFLQEDVKDAAEIMGFHASAMQKFFTAGWDPDYVVEAVTSGDLARLSGHHVGLPSVQLQPGEIRQPSTNGQVPALPSGRSMPLLASGEVRCPACDKLVARSLGPGSELECPRCKQTIAA